MTDTFGSDPHNEDPSAETDTQQDESVTEAPSDYEFSDDAASDKQLGDGPTRRSFLPIAAAIVGVVVLGVVAWWQLSASVPTSETASLPLPSPQVVQQQPLISPKTDAAPKGNADIGSTVSSNAQPSLPEPTLAPPKAVSNPVVAAPAAPVATAAPIAPTPAAPAFAPAAPVQVASAPVAPAASAPQKNEAADHRIDLLIARVDSLQKALDQATQQLKQMSASLPPASPADASASKALQDKMDKLEQQVAALNRAPTPSLAEPVQALPAQVTSEPEAVSVPALQAEPRKTKPQKAVAAHKAEAKPKKTHLKTASSAWVLRAASPDHAWISKTSASQDLREIHIGDTVSGIGKVTSIEAQGDKWVVLGAKGEIQ